MTISTTTNQITYAGDAITLGFSFPYPFITTGDLKVYVNGVQAVVGFVVTGTQPFGGSGTFSNGMVTFSVAPPALSQVLIYCDPDQLQSTSLPPNDPFPSKTVEKMIDKVTLLIQAIYRKFGNAITFPPGDTASGVLPDAATRASKVLTFDALGNAIVITPAAGSAASVLTLLADPTSAANGPSLLALNQTLNYVAGTLGDHERKYVNVTDYPWLAKGDGVTDDYADFAAAIVWCRANKRSLRVPNTSSFYLLSASLVLASDTLAPVSLIGEEPQFYNASTCVIQGNFNGPVLNCSGTVGTYSVGPYIGNLTIKNPNVGALACGIRADYSGGVRVEWCWIQARNFGIYSAAEMISPLFLGVSIDTSGFYGKGGYKLAARNAQIYGGRVYAQEIAVDYAGDALYASGLNVEFSQVCFRHGALSSAVFVGCHFESSFLLLTNAATVPISTSPWVNNASTGSGISGSVAFIGGVVSFSSVNSNLAVVKSSGGFTYRLSFDGVVIAHPNPVIGNSFAPGSLVALPSGTKITTKDTTGLLVQVPPSDAFSGYELDSGDNGLKLLDKLQANTGRVTVLRDGKITQQLGLANGAFIDIPTGFTNTESGVYEIAWRAATAGYEYAAVVPLVQSFTAMTLGTRLSALGAGSADANWTLAWVVGTASMRLTNASGGAKDLTINFQVKHQLV